MDTKVTLSFNKKVIEDAKEFAAEHDISLSRLTEYIYRQLTSKNYKSLDDLPISDWVNVVSEGKAEYGKSKTRKELKSEFFESRK